MKCLFRIGVILGLAVNFQAAMAQEIYSVNTVGIVQKSIEPGFNLIANPLNTGGNDISNVIPNGSGLVVFTYSAGTYQSVMFEDDGNGLTNGWSAARTLAPGQGFFIMSQSAEPVTITFAGEVPEGTLVNPLSAGFNLKSSIVPQAGQLDTTLEFPAQIGDTVFVYDKASETFKSTVYEDDGTGIIGWSIPELANIDVAQSFFVVPVGGAKNWTRSFSAAN